MNPMPRRFAVLLLVIVGVGGSRTAESLAGEPPAYEVYAVRYARLLNFTVANLVQGADKERKLDLAMAVWVLKGPGGRTVLVDAGFYQPQFMKSKQVADYTR